MVKAKPRPEAVRGVDIVSQALATAPALDGGGTLLLLDADGVVVDTWTLGGDVLEDLRAQGVAPGLCLAEHHAGTSAAGALVTRRLTIVQGPDHDLEALRGVTTVGAPVVEPSANRLFGALVVATGAAASDASGSWLGELVSGVEHDLLRRARRSEHVLMERFLQERSDSRHAVVALSAQIIITNAAAARMVGVEEQSRLWEHARQVVADNRGGPTTLEVGQGRSLSVECEPVTDGDETVGVVMRWRRATHPVAVDVQGPAPLLEGLAGRGARWRAMSARLASAGQVPTLLVGERGTGKTAVARSLAGELRLMEIDVADLDSVGEQVWCHQIWTSARWAEVVLVRHLEQLTPETAARVMTMLGELSSGVRVVATMRSGVVADASANAILDVFSMVVTVPPLRERIEDIPDLVRALTAKCISDDPSLSSTQWMTDALQTLTRLDWPGNVSSLESLVRRVLGQVRTGYVTARDLPAAVATNASRRKLSALDRLEAQAILQAIHDANGNKLAAAESLGIARSTLYRKLRAFGIDLSSSTF
ncbi:helix-turn-helix domain-containing protein [Nocardioides sp.]|uniref:helix-turn-helix domain-containing protein n=1 Tax=Nocardioides sp. TaxID=35761 RepID=UPI002634A553|nr:helix-turn-helix domain-containing protein [Nocardioides sp.]MDI6909215.1 helix-turn-helix domain-containing protein [Nocardioides sp.]